jgi:MoxR-like ATPase
MLGSPDRKRMIESLSPCLDAAQIIALRRATESVVASRSLIAYVQNLLESSRRQAEIRIGLSPRAGLAVLAAARAHALLANRSHVVPEDVQAVFPFIAAHRLGLGAGAHSSRQALVAQLIEKTPVR